MTSSEEDLESKSELDIEAEYEYESEFNLERVVPNDDKQDFFFRNILFDIYLHLNL